MLVEIRCDEFKSNSKTRPPIQFHKGLNTVIGSNTGSNSIGKSTFLMIIDFVFGGDDYIKKSTDVQKNVGTHRIYFTFEFSGKKYIFYRSTDNYQEVVRCNDNFMPQEVLSIENYCDFLFDHYGIDLPLTSFRGVISRYFRIYGRDNLSEKKPLNIVPSEKGEDAIRELMKLFNYYAALSDLAKVAKNSKSEHLTFKKAQSYDFIPNITKKKYQQNEKRIAELQQNLLSMADENNKALLGIDSQQAEEISKIKGHISALKRQRSRLISQLNAMKADMRPDIQQYGADFSKLSQFFPDTDLRKLEEIQQFHQNLSGILQSEFEEGQEKIQSLINLTNKDINSLEQQIIELGATAKLSKVVLDRYSTLDNELKSLTAENNAYDRLGGLKVVADRYKEDLDNLQKEQLSELQTEINIQMDKINDKIYSGHKKAPILTIQDGNRYTFMTPDDSGTGTNYKGMIVFDLAALSLTPLPAIAHDSYILKQIGDAPFENILKIYSSCDKQVFISIDKEDSYSEQSQEIMNKTAVLHLSEGGNELFGWAWNEK